MDIKGYGFKVTKIMDDESKDMLIKKENKILESKEIDSLKYF